MTDMPAATGGKKKQPAGEQSMVATMMDEAASRVPPQYAGMVRKLKPAVVGAAGIVDKAWPYVLQAYEFIVHLWIAAQPYNPQQFFPIFFGLPLCFFGGSYLTLIAAAEALRLTAWDRIQQSLQVLYNNYCVAREASKKDDAADVDGDGVVDVKQIDKKELLTRKLYIVAKSVNPDQTSDAIGAIWTGFLSVLATIRIKFAQFITLGCSIADMARHSLGPKLEPLINDALPNDLKKWAPQATRAIFNVAGVFLAFFLQRIIGGFHSAIRGGHLAVTNAITLAKKKGYIDPSFDEKSQKASLIGLGLAMMGFFWQLSNGFSVPFPLNLLLLPCSLLEWFLQVSLTIGL